MKRKKRERAFPAIQPQQSRMPSTWRFNGPSRWPVPYSRPQPSPNSGRSVRLGRCGAMPRVERGDPVAEVRVMERPEPVPPHNPFEGPDW